MGASSALPAHQRRIFGAPGCQLLLYYDILLYGAAIEPNEKSAPSDLDCQVGFLRTVCWTSKLSERRFGEAIAHDGLELPRQTLARLGASAFSADDRALMMSTLGPVERDVFVQWQPI